MLDLENYFKGNWEEQVGGFDLIYKGVRIYQNKGGVLMKPPAGAQNKTYLGCCNNRREQLRTLARALAAREKCDEAGVDYYGNSTTDSAGGRETSVNYSRRNSTGSGIAGGRRKK